MYNIKLVTDDLNLAAGFMGAVLSAKDFVKQNINKPFNFSIETNDPAVKILAEYAPVLKNIEWEEIEIPDSAQELQAFDQWAAQRLIMELSEGHGMVIDMAPVVNTLTYERLASAILKLKYDLHNKPSYWFPKLPVDRAFAADAVIRDEAFRPIAENFLKGMLAKENFNIVCTQDNFETIKYINSNLSAVFATPDDPINCILESYYEGFDKIAQATPLVIIAPDTFDQLDYRRCGHWPSCIPGRLTESTEESFQKGQIWATRKKFNFDHHEFQKSTVKSNG